MTKISLFKQIFNKYKLGIIFTYLLFGLEIIGSILLPFLLGKAIDGLIAGGYKELITLIIVECLWLLISVKRQRLDTKVFATIYTSIVTKFIIRNHATADISKLTARSNLAQEIVNFFEYDLGYMLSASANIIGSVIMIYYYNSYVFLAALCITIPISIINYYYAKKVQLINKIFNDEYEKNIDVITEGNPSLINEHYEKIRDIQIDLSNIEAMNSGKLEFLNILLIAITLLIVKFTIGLALTAGAILGIYNYILKFSSNLHAIPHLLSRMTNLNDIIERLDLEDSDLL
jgi:hypothetical protein